MKRDFIISEIKRTASDNDGVPLGQRAFATTTGIRRHDWYGRFWPNWSAALSDAGFEPNVWQDKIPEDLLLEKLVELISELDKFPTDAELRQKRRENPSFPSHSTMHRLGPRAERARRIIDYCSTDEDLSTVVAICTSIAEQAVPPANVPADPSEAEEFGTVYLIKSGRHYKVGRTNAFGRREREIELQLPDKAQTVHTITTDDPVGIEAYWHRRFADRRKNGEWFELSPEDIRAFKRRTFM